MTPFHLELIKTLHEDQRRRLGRRRQTDVRSTRPARRIPRD
jgi:hypothetical protein